MELNNAFSWNNYEIYHTTDPIDNEKDKINDKNQFIVNENYFDKKLSFNKQKYKLDLGACIVNSDNKILCFNKNTINNQSNCYFKVDELIIKEDKNKEIIAHNLFSQLDGPRFRVTNVFSN